MSDPFATNWSNVDLEREGNLELVSGMSFNDLILEIETGSVGGGVVNRETLTRHFEQHLRNIATNAREIFHDNIDNIIAYGNRHAIAEALDAERDEKDRLAVEQMRRDLYANTRQWRPISQKWFDYMLECLPPLRMGCSGFVNSEAYSSINDDDVYFVAYKVNGNCFAAYGTLLEWDHGYLSSTNDIPKW